MTDNVQLGKTPSSDQQRDAIHIAIAPVIAAIQLAPGQDVGFVGNSTERVWADGDPIGIIDPFLTSLVFPEQRCWMLLYPNTITSLRHDWTHPTFEKKVDLESAETSNAWLRRFADSADLSYDHMIDIVKDYCETGEPWVEQGTSAAQDTFYDIDNKEEFWTHFKRVTGIGNLEHSLESPFSCSC